MRPIAWVHMKSLDHRKADDRRQFRLEGVRDRERTEDLSARSFLPIEPGSDRGGHAAWSGYLKHNSQSRRNRATQDRHVGNDDKGRCGREERPGHWGHLCQGWPGVFPAGRCCIARQLHLRERPTLAPI
jgi:hypothetical protein